MLIFGTGGMSHQIQGKRAGLINKDFDKRFPRRSDARPRGAGANPARSNICARRATEGIELVMWLIMRGALGDKVEEVYRFYHVPASNTAVGHIILEESIDAPAARRRRRHENHARRRRAPSASSISTRIKNIAGIEVVAAVGRRADQTREVADKYGIPHGPPTLDEALEHAGHGRRDPVHADADAREPGDPVHEGRQARDDRDSARRHSARRARRSSTRREETGVSHGRAHAALQSLASMDSPAHQEAAS